MEEPEQPRRKKWSGADTSQRKGMTTLSQINHGIMGCETPGPQPKCLRGGIKQKEVVK